jgi:hypothetical protein
MPGTTEPGRCYPLARDHAGRARHCAERLAVTADIAAEAAGGMSMLATTTASRRVFGNSGRDRRARMGSPRFPWSN